MPLYKNMSMGMNLDHKYNVIVHVILEAKDRYTYLFINPGILYHHIILFKQIWTGV